MSFLSWMTGSTSNSSSSRGDGVGVGGSRDHNDYEDSIPRDGKTINHQRPRPSLRGGTTATTPTTASVPPPPPSPPPPRPPKAIPPPPKHAVYTHQPARMAVAPATASVATTTIIPPRQPAATTTMTPCVVPVAVAAATAATATFPSSPPPPSQVHIFNPATAATTGLLVATAATTTTTTMTTTNPAGRTRMHNKVKYNYNDDDDDDGNNDDGHDNDNNNNNNNNNSNNKNNNSNKDIHPTIGVEAGGTIRGGRTAEDVMSLEPNHVDDVVDAQDEMNDKNKHKQKYHHRHQQQQRDVSPVIEHGWSFDDDDDDEIDQVNIDENGDNNLQAPPPQQQQQQEALDHSMISADHVGHDDATSSSHYHRDDNDNDEDVDDVKDDDDHDDYGDDDDDDVNDEFHVQSASATTTTTTTRTVMNGNDTMNDNRSVGIPAVTSTAFNTPPPPQIRTTISPSNQASSSLSSSISNPACTTATATSTALIATSPTTTSPSKYFAFLSDEAHIPVQLNHLQQRVCQRQLDVQVHVHEIALHIASIQAALAQEQMDRQADMGLWWQQSIHKPLEQLVENLSLQQDKSMSLSDNVITATATAAASGASAATYDNHDNRTRAATRNENNNNNNYDDDKNIDGMQSPMVVDVSSPLTATTPTITTTTPGTNGEYDHVGIPSTPHHHHHHHHHHRPIMMIRQGWMRLERQLSCLQSQMLHSRHVTIQEQIRQEFDHNIRDAVETALVIELPMESSRSEKREGNYIRRWEEECVGMWTRRFYDEYTSRIVSFQMIENQFQHLQQDDDDDALSRVYASQVTTLQNKLRQEQIDRQRMDQTIRDQIKSQTTHIKRAILESVGDHDDPIQIHHLLPSRRVVKDNDDDDDDDSVSNPKELSLLLRLE